MRTGALVLAAGLSSRFGSPKSLARLDGRTILEHVLLALRDAGLDPIKVVLGAEADQIEAATDWPAGVLRMRNPDPARGLSSSLRDGLLDLAALTPRVGAAVIALGDQPRLRPDVVRALLDATAATTRPIVAPRYAAGGGPNPLLLRREGFALADEVSGDRGLGPVLAAHPDLVAWVDVPGDNPDVDTRDDLARVAERAWAERVRANRDQVDRIREVPDGSDFYGPVRSIFRADPRRTDEPVLDVLLGLVRAGETWLDIGAGAGRYALPIALAGADVIAIDPSAGMLDSLREQMAERGIDAIRVLAGRWPPEEGSDLAAALGSFPVADVALIAHVGYDVEAIGPFLDAMEAAARRLCVAILMERPPASFADACWPPIHGEFREPLPAMPALLDLLRARSRTPEVIWAEREPRRFADRAELETALRRQLWIADGGEKEGRFHAALDELIEVDPDGRLRLRGQRALPIGVATWEPVASSVG